MSNIDLQKFMELRESVRARQPEMSARTKNAAASKSTGASEDWRALLESKRQQIGLQASPPAKAVAPQKATASVGRLSADSMSGSFDEKIEALRDRKSQGLSVRELGNFIDVRA